MKPEVTNIVSNRSSRGGVKPGLIVLHTTEGTNRRGISDLQGLGEFFDRASTAASSHVANDAEGHDARFVPDDEKAWTCSNDNAFTLNLEQVAFASTPRKSWFYDHGSQLYNTAGWIAEWSSKWDIPIRRGIAPAGILIRKGVASHKQLGLLGGGHWDPGPSFPMRYVLLLARYRQMRDQHPGIVSASHPRHGKYKKVLRKVNRIRAHYDLEELR